METPYFPLYATDFLADTCWMSAVEVGVYTRLLCHAWKDSPVGTLPDDDDLLARLGGVNVDDWQTIKPIVMRPFKRGADGRWTHASLRAFFDKARQKSKSAQESAQVRWEKQKRPTPDAGGMRSHSDGKAPEQRSECFPEVRSQKSEERESREESTTGSLSPPAQRPVEEKPKLALMPSPADAFEPDPPPPREWTIGERFVLKACDLWEKPIVETNWKVRNAVKVNGQWVTERLNLEKRIGGTPDLFRKFWQQEMGRSDTPRPDYVAEHWGRYDRWLIENHETHRQEVA